MTGGVAALVSAMFVGPRHGRFVTQYRYPAGGEGSWYVRGEELPLEEVKRGEMHLFRLSMYTAVALSPGRGDSIPYILVLAR